MIKALTMELFDRQWSSYRAVVDHDLMEHAGVAAAAASALEAWLARRAADAPPPTLVDLGCGDLARMAPVLRHLPLGHYTGLDLAAAVLPLAEQALGPVAYPTAWRSGDLLAWALETEGPPTDILHSAFAIHHLDDDQKPLFLAAARRRMRPGGLFLWGDVFRLPGESRNDYVKRYIERIWKGWAVMNREQMEHVVDHLSRFDIPADPEAIAAAAEACGWSWRWAWRGSHQAEALAVLTPVP